MDENNAKVIIFCRSKGLETSTVDSRFNEVPRDWGDFSVISRVRLVSNTYIQRIFEKKTKSSSIPGSEQLL